MIESIVRRVPAGAGAASTSPAANAPRTEGLTPFDRDRAASVADEGGTSAAEVEKPKTGRTDADEVLGPARNTGWWRGKPAE